MEEWVLPDAAVRPLVALAADPDVMRRSGSVLRVGDLARAYGFTDVDSRGAPPFAVS